MTKRMPQAIVSNKSAALSAKRLRMVLLGVLMTAATLTHATSMTRTSAFEYDVVTGLMTKEIIEPDDPQFRLETAYTYDTYGNKITATISSPATGAAAIAPRSSRTGYDTNGQFPISSSNALDHTETRTYDPRFGGITSLTGPNGLTTYWQYDGFGRKVSEIRADGTQTQWTYLYCDGINDGTAPCPTRAAYVVQVTPLAADGVTANGPWSKTYYDSLQREIKSETVGFDGSSIIARDTDYDSLGRVERRSLPYFVGQIPQWSTIGYDSLSRAVLVTAPDGSQTSTHYDGLTMTVTNALKQTQTTIKNSQGKLVEVIDTQNNRLRSTYDAIGNLLTTTDPQGNVVTLTYDVRGRKVSMTDPDMGTWTYDYNVVGELIQQTDAKGQVSSMIYDRLGRMTSRVEADLISTWNYDDCSKGIGKVCSSTTDNGYRKVNSYDHLGRNHATTTTMDAVYTNGATFDADGRISTLTYPTGLTLEYRYTSLGYLREVRNQNSNVLLWRADMQNAMGQLLQQTYGNEVVTQQVFDEKTGRLINIYAGADNHVQHLSYAYDGLGNLISRKDDNQKLTEVFLYDSLNRLGNATLNAPVGLTTTDYRYDKLGNITKRSDLGTYVYGDVNERPHALKELHFIHGGKLQYSYDANGSLVSEVAIDSAGQIIADRGRSEVYTSFGMPQAIGAPGMSVAFAYGPEHQRIKQIAMAATTIYLHPNNSGGLFYEKDLNTDGTVVHKHYITADGQVVAQIRQVGNTQTVLYLHRDQLGSTTTITDADGNVIERLAYEPFGKRRFPEGRPDDAGEIVGIHTDRGFTNHEHLEELGLIHMNGRIYDPAIGRFMSADPYIQAPDNLQGYNRYAYVFNSPLNLTDPTGYFSLRNVFKVVAIAVASYYTAGWASSTYYGAAVGSAATAAAATGATLTVGQLTTMWATAQIVGGAVGGFAGSMLASKGNFNAGFKGAVIGGLFGAAGGVGESASYARYAAHAGAGCASGELQGGGCVRGAASAVVGKYVSNQTARWDDVSRGVAATVAGGTVSVIGGGKFDNGAATAAFGYLFNELLHNGDPKKAMQQSGYARTVYSDGTVCPGNGPCYNNSGTGDDGKLNVQGAVNMEVTAMMGVGGISYGEGVGMDSSGNMCRAQSLCGIAGLGLGIEASGGFQAGTGQVGNGWQVGLVGAVVPIVGMKVNPSYGSSGISFSAGASVGLLIGGGVKMCAQKCRD